LVAQLFILYYLLRDINKSLIGAHLFIQTEETPNPETLKFLPGCIVMPEGTASYILGQPCDNSPLARRLMGIEGIAGVFFGADFITLTKKPGQGWDLLKPDILAVLMDHFVANLPVVTAPSVEGPSQDELDDPLVCQIRELLDTRIRPAVAQDGGDIVFHSFEDGIVYLKMQGACSGCPSSTATLKSGIENMLRHYVPEVQEVRAI
jgi:Fe-S cluster biogenesis protein NfuA